MPRRFVLGALAGAMLATSAWAGEDDGAIEINAVRAAAGGVNGDLVADPPGFPVIITQPGSYRLTSNLAGGGTSQPLISIRAPDVHLDLAGFALSSGLHGIDSAETNVSVVNGSIYGMTDFGIWLQGDRARVERVRSLGNGSGSAAIDLSGEGSFVGDSVAIGSQFGISIVGGTIRGCVASSSGNGISLLIPDTGPGANVVTESVAIGNGVGIRMENASALDNLIVGNLGTGLVVLTQPPGSWASSHASSVISGNGSAVQGPAVKTGPSVCNGALCP